MTQQPALVVGQVWKPQRGHALPRRITAVLAEAVEYRAGHGSRRKSWTDWTAWRDWQQRHDARAMEGGEGE